MREGKILMIETFWFYARRAGFCFWEKESWNYRNRRIDWSSDYDDELQRYTREVVVHTLRRMSCDKKLEIEILNEFNL